MGSNGASAGAGVPPRRIELSGELSSGVGDARPTVDGDEPVGLQNGEKQVDIRGGELDAGGIPREGEGRVDGEDGGEDGGGVELTGGRLAFVVNFGRSGKGAFRAAIRVGGLEHPRLCVVQHDAPAGRGRKKG